MRSNQEESSKFINEAMRIINMGQQRNVFLRLMGGFAIRLHCSKFAYLYDKLERKPAYDLDLVTYSKFRPQIKNLFKDLGYSTMASMALMFDTGRNRQVYTDEAHNRSVDIFFDKLEMCHTIEFKDRLELDTPTITLSDLLLQKAQICKINEKDIIDMIILLREHKISEQEQETINIRYIAKLLSNDWGFWYTFKTNLNKVKDFLGEYKVLTDEDRNDVATKIDTIIQALEAEPKSLKWKMRAKIGTSKKWYTEVEELVR